ncbi:MAG: hypothetical protein ACM3WV_02995 [Bacillota bacterium]
MVVMILIVFCLILAALTSLIHPVIYRKLLNFLSAPCGKRPDPGPYNHKTVKKKYTGLNRPAAVYTKVSRINRDKRQDR